MRAIIQRVSEAFVKVDNEVTGSISKGLLVLVGIEDADSEDDVEWLAGKITNLRVFNDSQGVMNLSLSDIDGNILLVSQFTLFASTKKGNRPSYIRASKPEFAIRMYERMIDLLEKLTGKPVQKGVFGANMKVSLVNDGPVTIFIDSKQRE